MWDKTGLHIWRQLIDVADGEVRGPEQSEIVILIFGGNFQISFRGYIAQLFDGDILVSSCANCMLVMFRGGCQSHLGAVRGRRVVLTH